MALQKVFTQAYTEELRTHIDPQNYKGDAFIYDNSQVKTLMRVRHDDGLAKFMVDHAESDFDCAIALFEAFKGISPVFAQEERLWVYLSHVDLYPYLKKRWPLPEKDDKQFNHVRDHWFRGANSMIRGSLVGLWWAVYCTVDYDREDQYELTRILFSNYSFRTTFFGSTELFWYKEATKGILEFLVDNPEIVNQNFENRCLFITKYFNQLGGTKQLASLDKEYFYKECERIKPRILIVKSREDVQNRNAMSIVNE